MDIFKFAINMELEGKKYYLKQAEKNKDNSLFEVFKSLAEDEDMHAELISSKKKGSKFSKKSIKKSQAKSLFSDNSQKISEIKIVPEQLEAYQFALDKEKESIDLYKELSNKSDVDKELFDFLIEEEEKHYALVANMVELLSHPKDWVESAEFGVREDY